MQQRFNWHHGLALTAALLSLFVLAQTVDVPATKANTGTVSVVSSFIVQSDSAADAERLVLEAGGTVTATLKIINAVGANLDSEQVAWLLSRSNRIKIHKDNSLTVSGPVAETDYPTLVGANLLHERGIKGDGVTIAVLDTGLWKSSATQYTSGQRERILAQHDVLQSSRNDDKDKRTRKHKDKDKLNHNGDDNDDDDGESAYKTDIDDWNGHGTHITSIMASSFKTNAGRYQGVAPNANLVAVRAFEADGSGSYLNVIKALDWIVSHRRKFNIRILNLSFGAPAASHYWDDPVNQAVMAAWQSGIIVVAAAGNSGPGPMTIGVPANVPYVITVGATTDNFTADDTTDDRLASFSAAGPTVEGFVKPEVVAPGGHMLGQMPPYAWLALKYPDFVYPDGDYFRMSGTSQSAAVVSGVLALMLQAEPALRPDDAKCRLMASARKAFRDNGLPAYSVFQQGAGLIDAVAAVNNNSSGCANRGMRIVLESSFDRHYAGPAGVDEDGIFYLIDEDGRRLSGDDYEWRDGEFWADGALWPEGTLWSQGALWNNGVRWNDSSALNPDSLLSNGALWPEGSLWPEGLARSVSTSSWVEAE